MSLKVILFPLVALVAGVACSSSPEPKATPGAVVDSTTSTTMSYEACVKSAEYGNGGQYAVEYDNGVCNVQKPADTPIEPVTAVSYQNCAAVKAAGKAPIYRGDPGFGEHLDRDGDGVGCVS
jgi:hypothetical protein